MPREQKLTKLWKMPLNDNDNNNNNSNNNSRIQRRSSRFFLQSPCCAANCLQHVHSSGNHVQITCNTSSAYHVQLVLSAT